MAGRETADIVFCMDASGSMSPCFDGVRKNVVKLLKSIESTGLQRKWDVRFDYLAYSNGSDSMRLETLNKSGKSVLDSLYGGGGSLFQGGSGGNPSDFFTSDVSKFRDGLERVNCRGDEATILALDIAADFPFRDAKTCHRAVVLFTDEAVDDGTFVEESKSKLMDLAKKYQDKKIMLFMVTPDCPTFDTLSQIDKCEWTVDESSGLGDINFGKLMESIGKSVSISQTSSSSSKNAPTPLFNESNWRGWESDNSYVDVKLDGSLKKIFQ